MPEPRTYDQRAATARLMLVVLSLSWGFTWPAMKIALTETPPFSMRAATMLLGAVTLFILARVQHRRVRIPFGTAWLHLFAGGLMNVVGFTMFTSFAQLHAATSRVAILAYTMPIWAAMLAWPILGERVNMLRGVALALCVAGIGILIAPLATAGVPGGILLALAGGLSWGAGTVYLKWARVDADPLAVAAWQIAASFGVVGICVPLVEGSLHLWPISLAPALAIVFTGIVGSGLAYLLWFEIICRLPAMTASLGVLSVPVVGVVSSALILGERPTLADIVGFALIFAASACVLLAPTPQIAARAPAE